MRKIKITVGVFLILILSSSFLTLSALFSKEEISAIENRSLQQMPAFTTESYLNGSFFKDLEGYFYDHFPYRDTILQTARLYDKLKGIQPEIMAIQKGQNMNLVNTHSKEETQNNIPSKSQNNKEVADFKEEKQERSPENKKDFSAYKTQTQNLSIMAVKDKLLSLFHFDEHKVADYAAALNQMAQKMPVEIQMYSLLVPTQVGLTGEEFLDFSDPQDMAIDYIYSLLDKKIQPISVFPALYEKREEYLYFRSDHHWTQLGAYYAAKTFAEKTGINFPLIEEYELHSFEGFLGYLYNNNPVEKVASNPDRIDAYALPGEMPMLTIHYYNKEGKPSQFEHPLIRLNKSTPINYGIFLGGDYPIIYYKNPKPAGGRNLMVVKDSYANAFIPWLAAGFDKIIVIDPRFYQGNIYQYAKEQEITDFMVLDYVSAATLEGYIDFLENLSNSDSAQ